MTDDQIPAGDAWPHAAAPPAAVDTARAVTVAFSRGGQQFARIVLLNGQLVDSDGDVAWFDLSVVPSDRLGRPVRFLDNAQEWARRLPGAYGMNFEVTLTQTPLLTGPDTAAIQTLAGQPPDGSLPGARTYCLPASAELWQAGRPLELAGWWTRAAALLVDSLIVSVPAGAVSGLLFGFHAWATRSQTSANVSIFWDWKQILVGIVFGLGYFVLATSRPGARNGQSVGKRLLRIRVVRDDAQPVDASCAARRYGTLYGLSVLLGVGPLLDYLWPLGDSTNRALHDKAAHTHVVSARSPGQSRRNPAAVILIAGVGFVVLVGVLIGLAGPSDIQPLVPAPAAQSAYLAASQTLRGAEQASQACSTSGDRSGPLSQPGCLPATVRAVTVALNRLAAANARAQAGLGAGPCATALSHESQAIHATQAAVRDALQALLARDAVAFAQAQQQALAAQQAAASSEAQFPLSACSSPAGQSAAA